MVLIFSFCTCYVCDWQSKMRFLGDYISQLCSYPHGHSFNGIIIGLKFYRLKDN